MGNTSSEIAKNEEVLPSETPQQIVEAERMANLQCPCHTAVTSDDNFENKLADITNKLFLEEMRFGDRDEDEEEVVMERALNEYFQHNTADLPNSQNDIVFLSTGITQQMKGAETVATLPWFTSKETQHFEKKLEDTIYFKELMEVGDEERGKLNGLLYRVLNECFPPYIPIRFYTMNVNALAKDETKVKANMVLASRHVKKILSCGSYLFSDLHKSIKKGSGATTYQRLLSLLQRDRSKLKPNFEKCQIAQEFLLEPWVLVQLPFYPAVLHQWIVACLAEYLKFKEQLALFNTLNVPRSFNQALIDLQSMDKLIHRTLTKLLVVLQLNPTSSDNPFQYNSCLEFFGQDFSKTVQALKFLSSSKYLDIIKTLKRWSLNEDVEHRCGEGIDCCRSCSKLKPDTMAFLYTYDFWTKPEGMSYIFGDSHTKCMKYKAKHKQASHSQQHCYCNNVMSLPFVGSKLSFVYPNPSKAKTPDTADFLKFVDEKIISPGWLKGMEKEEMLSKIKQDKKSLPKLLDAYSYYLWHAENSQGICAEDRGVIYEINMMTSQVVMSEILATMIKQLHNILKHGGVYINAVGCEGPDLTCSEIDKSLPKLEKPCKKWTIEGILAQIEKQCPPPQSKECPGRDVGIEKVIGLFEARVKHLTYKMYKNRLGTVRKGKKVQLAYVELPMVQYILPSMIASVHNLLAASEEPEPQDVEKLISFLHFLISEYENERGNLVKLGSNGGCINFHTVLQCCCWDEFATLFRQPCVKIPKLSHQLFDPDLPFNTEVHKIIWGVFNDDLIYFPGQDKNWRNTFQEWNLHIFRFHSKVCRALELTAQKFNYPMEPECDWLVFGTKSYVTWLFESLTFGSCLSTWNDISMIRSTLDESSELRRASTKDPRLEKLADMKLFQATAVHFYLTQQNSDHRAKSKAAKFLMPITPKTSLETAFCAYVDDDWWLLRQQMAAWATVAGCGDQSLVSLKFAKSKEDYIPVLNTLGPDMKVKMKQPGEITFFPIKHCRWCGLVDCAEFRMCEMCQSETEYWDKNFFCSRRCEYRAMEQVHGEHHQRFVISKLKF